MYQLGIRTFAQRLQARLTGLRRRQVPMRCMLRLYDANGVVLAVKEIRDPKRAKERFVLYRLDEHESDRWQYVTDIVMIEFPANGDLFGA